MKKAEKAYSILMEHGYKNTEPRKVLLDFMDK